MRYYLINGRIYLIFCAILSKDQDDDSPLFYFSLVGFVLNTEQYPKICRQLPTQWDYLLTVCKQHFKPKLNALVFNKIKSQASTEHDFIKFWEPVLSQTHSTEWRNRAMAVSEKCTAQHTSFCNEPGELESQGSNQWALWLNQTHFIKQLFICIFKVVKY